MSTPVINPVTGLPELPEGHYWRVRADNVIQIMRKPVNSDPWTDWKVTYANKGKTLNGEKIAQLKELTDRYEAEAKPYETKIETDKKQRRYGSYFYDKWTYAYVHYKLDVGVISIRAAAPISKANLLEEVTKVYDAWQAEVERLSLFGDYPPKKHEV